jgi:hypothetical protein
MLIWIAPSSGWTDRILAEICFRSNDFRVSSENGIPRTAELVPGQTRCADLLFRVNNPGAAIWRSTPLAGMSASSQNEHGVSQLIVQGQAVVRLIAEVVHTEQFEFRNGGQQSAKLIGPIDSQHVVTAQPNDACGQIGFQRETNGFQPCPTIEIKDSHCHGDAATPIAYRPSLAVVFRRIRGQQMKPKDIQSATA